MAALHPLALALVWFVGRDRAEPSTA
jgi:hypothetical protein